MAIECRRNPKRYWADFEEVLMMVRDAINESRNPDIAAARMEDATILTFVAYGKEREEGVCYRIDPTGMQQIESSK